jgi:hypothetical protein
VGEKDPLTKPAQIGKHLDTDMYEEWSTVSFSEWAKDRGYDPVTRSYEK